MPIYLGAGGVNKTANDIYVGVGGVNKKVTEAYVGVGGVNKKAYVAATQLTVSSVDAGLNMSGWGITAGQYLYLKQEASAGTGGSDANKALYFAPNPYNLVGKTTMSVDWDTVGSTTCAYAFVINGSNVIYYNGYTTIARQTTDISLSSFQGAYSIYMWVGRWGNTSAGGGTMRIYSIKLDGVPIFTP